MFSHERAGGTFRQRSPHLHPATGKSTIRSGPFESCYGLWICAPLVCLSFPCSTPRLCFQPGHRTNSQPLPTLIGSRPPSATSSPTTPLPPPLPGWHSPLARVWIYARPSCSTSGEWPVSKQSEQRLHAEKKARGKKLDDQSLHKNTSQYDFVLQSLHKVLPSTTSYYKACTKYFPHLHTFSSSHLLHIFSSSHLLIFTPSSHLRIFTFSYLHTFLTSSHLLIFLHTFSSSHIHTFSSSHLHSIFTASSQHLHSIFTASSQHLHSIFTASSQHLHSIFTASSQHLHSIFTASSHLHIFTPSLSCLSCPLALLPSCPLALFPSCPLALLPLASCNLALFALLPSSLSFFSVSLLRRRAVPTRRHEMQPFRTKRKLCSTK